MLRYKDRDKANEKLKKFLKRENEIFKNAMLFLF
jgi:hypothetical protein